MWNAGSDKIKELIDYSRKKFDIELPLAKEVLHMNHYCWSVACFFNGKHDRVSVELKKDKPKKALLRWWHYFGTGSWTETLEIPEDVVWEIHYRCLEILNDKCEELAEMCGWYKEHPREEE